MSKTNESPSGEMTFFEHISALRPHLTRVAVVLLVLTVVAFLGKEFVIDKVLFGPRSLDFPTNRFFNWLGETLGIDALKVTQINFQTINTTMAGQFQLHIRISIISAFVLSVPYLLWEVWRFIKPALTANEARGATNFVFYISLCFMTGIAFGYFVIAPLAINFFANYAVSPQIVDMIDVNSYFSTITNISLACGAVFQLPILVFFLAKMGIITGDFMRKYRRHAILVLAILAGIITPPDVVSLILVALPMYGLYELSIRLADKVGRERAARDKLNQ